MDIERLKELLTDLMRGNPRCIDELAEMIASVKKPAPAKAK